jgi:tRNA modification GTPase
VGLEKGQFLVGLLKVVDTSNGCKKSSVEIPCAQVALVGRPNVGKSSLLNALVGWDRAIVTDLPGTTRDVVEASVDMHGIPIRLLDTAGLRIAADEVETLGVQRAQSVAIGADIVVMVLDSQVC